MYGRGVALAMLGTLLAGCGMEAGPKTARVAGQVILDGKPLENVEVHFLTEKHSGYGKTDSEGKFKLVSGAEIGDNRVYFSKIQDKNFNPDAGMDAGQFEAAALSAPPGAPAAKAIVGQQIPAEYASAADSTLTFKVPDGGTESAIFELDSKKK